MPRGRTWTITAVLLVASRTGAATGVVGNPMGASIPRWLRPVLGRGFSVTHPPGQGTLSKPKQTRPRGTMTRSLEDRRIKARTPSIRVRRAGLVGLVLDRILLFHLLVLALDLVQALDIRLVNL